MSKWSRVIVIMFVPVFLGGIYAVYKALDYRRHVNVHLNKYINLVKDFSGRDVYAMADDSLHADTIIPGRVVFLGSQVVQDWPLREEFPQRQAIDRGVRHQRAGGMLLRFQPDVVDLMPEAVLIEISSYNLRAPTTPEELLDYVISMADIARMHAVEPILMTMIPPSEDSSDLRQFEEPHQNYMLMDSLRLYNSLLREYVQEEGIPLLNASALVSNESGFLDSRYTEGGIGLNQQGYELLSVRLRSILDSLGVVEPTRRVP